MLTVAVNFFATEFGGATVIAAQGHHVQGQPPRRTQEEVHIVSAFATRQALRRHLRTLQELAADFCIRFEQESVAYEIDGVFRLVSPPAADLERDRWLRSWSPRIRARNTRAWMRYASVASPRPPTARLVSAKRSRRASHPSAQ